jgi:hypothetical protein
MVVHRALDAHLGLCAVTDRPDEITIHGTIAADVAEPGKSQARRACTAHHDEGAVGFEGNDALAAKDLRQPQAAEQRRNLTRVVEGSDSTIVVRKADEHALRTAIRAMTRDGRPIAVRVDDARSETVGEMEPVDAFFEERIAACHLFVVAPVVTGLQPMRDRREVREHHLTQHASGNQLAQFDGERLVMIVLPHEHHTPGAIARRRNRLVILDAQERRLLHEDMFARGERRQRERQVITRRHRDDNRIDVGIVDGRRIVGI